MKFVFRIIGGINCWNPVEDSGSAGPSSLPLGRNTYVLFNTDIVNFVWKTDEAGSIVLLIFFFGGAWIFGGWGVVGWGRKSYLGPAEIVSFSSRSFSHLNQLWFKCKTPLLFFLIIFYYTSFDQQSSADVLQNECS